MGGGDSWAMSEAPVASRPLPAEPISGPAPKATSKPGWPGQSSNLLGEHERREIEAWMEEGREVIDVGPQPGRAFYPMATGEDNAMEQNVLRGYDRYSMDVLPGEADWWIDEATG